MRLLVVESDAPLSEYLRDRLQADGFMIDIAADGPQAERLLKTQAYEVMILDLGISPAEAFATLLQLRQIRPEMMVLLLSGNASADERASGLDAGADDYLTKPFRYMELVARIRALLRRKKTPAKATLQVEDLELDRIGRTVRRSGCDIDLTQREFALLEFLMQRPRQAVSRMMIAEQAWKLDSTSTTNVVDVYINYLRKKIDAGFDYPLIRTVRGVGYQIGA
jgi:DNA-binding response OmpR family regulator